MKELQIIKEDKEKGRYLALMIGDDIKYLAEYNTNTFKLVARRYGVLLTKKKECIILEHKYPYLTPYAVVKEGEDNQEGFAKYYVNKYKAERVDITKPLFITKLSSRIDVERKYYVLDDRAIVGERELSEAEKEDLIEYYEWYENQLEMYAKRYYTTKRELTTFDIE